MLLLQIRGAYNHLPCHYLHMHRKLCYTAKSTEVHHSEVPPRGLTYKIKLGYHRGRNRLPTAECCLSVVNLPTIHDLFEEFARSMDEGVIGCGDRFLRE